MDLTELFKKRKAMLLVLIERTSPTNDYNKGLLAAYNNELFYINGILNKRGD